MTTVIVDTKFNKIVTDTQTTITDLKITLFPKIGMKKEFRFKHGILKIIPYKHNSVFVSSGVVPEITRFIEQYKKGRVIKTKDSTVLLVKNNYPYFKITAYENGEVHDYSDTTGFLTMGSGGNYACGVMEALKDDEYRAEKALNIASIYDFHTNDDVYTYTFPQYDDIC